MQKICEIKANKRNVCVQGKITDAGEIRKFDRFGGEGRLRTYTLTDDTGEVALTLWDDDVDRFVVGDQVTITNANSKLWNNKVQLSTSRKSTIEKSQ